MGKAADMAIHKAILLAIFPPERSAFGGDFGGFGDLGDILKHFWWGGSRGDLLPAEKKGADLETIQK